MEDYKRILIKDGLIIDGTGNKGYLGSVIIKDGYIEEVIEGEWRGESQSFTEVVDANGLLVCPGFIDMHSHLDWYLPSRGRAEYKIPFIKQGITTVVSGNCGYSAAGLKKDTKYIDYVDNNLFKEGCDGVKWRSFDEYFNVLEEAGLSHNAAVLAGHGTARSSVAGRASTIDDGELDEIMQILDRSMEEGAAGVSFGLQYEPGQYCTSGEIKKAAKLVKARNKLLTAHARAYSVLSGDYPLIPFGRAHNLKGMDELINIAEDTGVNLEISHLIFVGKSTHKTCEEALKLIDKAVSKGIDVNFDTYGHHCGVSVITVFLPPWFKSKGIDACSNSWLLGKLKLMMAAIFKILGFDFSNIQILDAHNEELSCFNGMYLSDIAKMRGMSGFDNYIDFVKKSNGKACVLMHGYTSEENLYELIKHKSSMFMTDAWIEPGKWQNPAAYGSIPRIIQLVREKKLLTREETIYKLTGACARKSGIKDRGYIKKGQAADITILDWDNVKFNAVSACTSGVEPSGISHVFINGGHVLIDGVIDSYDTFGRVVKL